MALQVLAVFIIGWSLLSKRSPVTSTAAQQLLGLALLVVLIVGIQLIPLPPGVWTELPGRERVADGFSLLGVPVPWMPISLAPHQTLASGLWLLPAFATLLSVVRLGAYKSAWIAWAVITVTGASVLFGALQLLGGESSGWYLYEITNYGSATGFFANSNHMATLLVSAIPFFVALYLGREYRGSAQRASGLLVILAGAFAVIVVGVGINGSLAGIGLSVPVIALTLLTLADRHFRLPRWIAAIPFLLAAGAIYFIFTGPFGNNLLGTEAETQGSRRESIDLTVRAAKDFLPTGSGLGTFDSIYRTYEDPATIDRVYMNHAHSDVAELLLETGLIGMLVLLLFLYWWGRRIIAIWRSSEPDYFARAATIATAAILAHSFVDYPLRTAAISALFAVCCGLMADSRSSVRRSSARPARAKHLTAD